jgi:hypothetical protein
MGKKLENFGTHFDFKKFESIRVFHVEPI